MVQEGGAVHAAAGLVLYSEGSSPDALQLLFTPFGEEPIGLAWEGEGEQDRAGDLLGQDEHTDTWAEKHWQGEC